MSTNTLGYYNPNFYAQEALILLEHALGMANRVYRGYEMERRTYEKGQYINIRKPSTFTAASAPSSAQNITTQSVQVNLSNWYETKFALTDKELAYTGDRIITDHIAPAVYSLADKIDSTLAALYVDIPAWEAIDPASPAASDFTNAWQILFDNGAPQNDGKMHCMLNGLASAGFMAKDFFYQYNIAGQDALDTLKNGSLGKKFGFEIFSNQNVQTHTSGTSTDLTGAVDNSAGYAAATTTIHADALGNGTVVAGDKFKISTGYYVITTTSTISGNEGDLTFAPGLRAAVSDDDVITGLAADHYANLAFHENAFALVMAPLPEMGNELGAKVATVTDPKTGLSLRSRIYYVGNSSEVHVAIDALWGVKTLDRDLAVVLSDNVS